MVDRYEVVLSIVAVAIMIAVPIFCVVLYDFLAGRWDEPLGRWRLVLHTAKDRRRDLRRMRQQHGVPIEQVAANLRRLRAAVACDANRSAAHQIGNRLAYDRVLVQACDMLGVVHDLDKNSGGIERDIERFRLEAELERAGVIISGNRFGQAA
jgi:hypothetical protein